MIQTNTEYMSDPARVARVVKRFMNMTLGELSNSYTKKYIKYVMDRVISNENLSAEKIQDMSYLEFACLIDSMGANPAYDCLQHDSISEQLIYYRMVAYILMEGRRVSIPVKLFSALPLEAFYTYMDHSSAKGDMMGGFESWKRCCRYREGYTVKDFISEKLGAISQAWSMSEPVEDYEEEMIYAHQDIGNLLIDSFLKAFSREDVRDIYEKYQEHSAWQKSRGDHRTENGNVAKKQMEGRRMGQKMKDTGNMEGKEGN